MWYFEVCDYTYVFKGLVGLRLTADFRLTLRRLFHTTATLGNSMENVSVSGVVRLTADSGAFCIGERRGDDDVYVGYVLLGLRQRRPGKGSFQINHFFDVRLCIAGRPYHIIFVVGKCPLSFPRFSNHHTINIGGIYNENYYLYTKKSRARYWYRFYPLGLPCYVWW